MKTTTITNTTTINTDDDLIVSTSGNTVSVTKPAVIQPAPTPTPSPTPAPVQQFPLTQFAFGQPVQLPRPWRHVYSQLQAFNSDDSMMIVYNIDTGCYGLLKPGWQTVPSWTSNKQSPRWYKDDIVYIDRDTNSIKLLSGLQIYKHPNPLSESITYEEITGDIITCYDKTTRKLFDIHLVTGAKTDWPAFSSAMGTDVDWATNYHGTLCAMMRGTNKGLYHHTGTGWVRSTDHTRHGDLGQDTVGKYYLTEKWYAGAGTGDVSLWKDYLMPTIADGLVIANNGWARAEHISLCGPQDVALITAGNEYTNNPETKGKIYTVDLKTKTKRVICDHGSTDWGTYWNQPHATLSKSGKLAAFASNKSGQVCGYIVGCQP